MSMEKAQEHSAHSQHAAHASEADCCKTGPPAEKKPMLRWLHSFAYDREFSLERRILQVSALSTLLLVMLFAVSFATFFRSSSEFLSSTGIYIIYLIVAVTSNGSAILHFRSYRGDVSCTDGMMIGMTFGMMSGFMVGAAVGATNGMFMGSVVGVTVGIVAGILTGKCCGIMGIMEGMMAGLMGGLMGPMTSVMMYADNLLYFMPYLFGVCLLILFGLTYMNYSGSVRQNHREIQEPSLAQFFAISFLACVIIAFIMAYGPRSALFALSAA